MTRVFAASLLIAFATVPALAAPVDFAHQIVPLLKKHCAECHAGDKKKGSFSINTRESMLKGGETGAALIPGKVDAGEMLLLIEDDDPELRMPPVKNDALTPAEVALLKRWVAEGAKWEPGFTFGEGGWEPPLKPRRVQLPPTRDGRDHPIDRLLDANLAKSERPGTLSDAAFLRRATLDVTGLLPTPQQLQAFVADKALDKRAKLIDRLLADDIAYADHWLTMWNDLLRNDYTGTGFITGGRKQITTWLYGSLRSNKPYDQFVRELVAPATDSAGFINGIKWRGEVNASQTREIQFAQNISQVFLGINMKCASCHDSFIDRWTLSEAYNLAAIYADTTLELNRCDKPTGKMATPKWIFPEIGDVDPTAPKAQRLEQLAGLMTHPDNGRFTRTVVNRIWDRLMGRGIVHPVDAMHTKPWNEDLLDYLAVRFAEGGYDLRKFIRFVMTSQAYHSKSVVLEAQPDESFAYAGPLAKRMTAEQFIDSIWQITRTHPGKPAGKVDRVLRVPGPAKIPQAIALNPIQAKWIWHTGAVGQKSQLRHTFKLANKPTAARMIVTCDNAFVMKINGKAVASSKDWQRPVVMDIAAHLVKGDNTFEVDAEMFGGGAGFICQIVVMDGGKRHAIATDKSWQARPPKGRYAAAKEIAAYAKGPWGAVFNNAPAPGAAGSAPTPPVRAALVKNDFLMRSLGRPHRDQVVTTRPGELTTLQAIDLSNGDILAGYLKAGAKRLAAEKRTGPQLVDYVYEHALSRKPTDAERSILIELVGDGADAVAIEDLLWTVFMQPEFQIIR